MINADLLDCPNKNLLDSNIAGSSRNSGRAYGRRRRIDVYSNASDVDYGALATATVGLGSAIASRQPNEAKRERKAQKKDMKMSCGRKPLLKKKRGAWDACVKDYMKAKEPTSTPVESSQSYKSNTQSERPSRRSSSSSSDSEETKILGMKKSIAIPVIVGVVAIAGFFVYKKFFAKGVASATPAATPSVTPTT